MKQVPVGSRRTSFGPGRIDMTWRPGANDVRALAPGVYFVREAQAQAIRKVVVAQ